jgi:hypothetical protein
VKGRLVLILRDLSDGLITCRFVIPCNLRTGSRRTGIVMEFDTGSENEGKAKGNAHLALCGGSDMIGRSDCEMKWLVGGLLCFAIFVVTLADQDGHENDANHLTKQKLTGDEVLLHANPGTLSNMISLNAESAGIKMTSGQTASVDHTDTVFSARDSFPQTESSESSRTPGSAQTSETSQFDTEANASPMSSFNRQNCTADKHIGPTVRPKIHNLRHSLPGRLKLIDVKTRLIALWHQSLARSQRPPSSPMLRNLK